MADSGPAAGYRRKPALAGWTRRMTIDQPRLSEMAAQYRALGFEVLLDDFNRGAAEGGCTSCFAGVIEAGKFKTIYTRPMGQAGEDDPI